MTKRSFVAQNIGNSNEIEEAIVNFNGFEEETIEHFGWIFLVL